MQVIDHIPVRYDEEELRRELKTETLKEKKEEIISLIEESRGRLVKHCGAVVTYNPCTRYARGFCSSCYIFS